MRTPEEIEAMFDKASDQVFDQVDHDDYRYMETVLSVLAWVLGHEDDPPV